MPNTRTRQKKESSTPHATSETRIFSPPRTRNAKPVTMEHSNQHHSNDPFLFHPDDTDVLNAPVGSFADDSPPRDNELKRARANRYEPHPWIDATFLPPESNIRASPRKHVKAVSTPNKTFRGNNPFRSPNYQRSPLQASPGFDQVGAGLAEFYTGADTPLGLGEFSPMGPAFDPPLSLSRSNSGEGHNEGNSFLNFDLSPMQHQGTLQGVRRSPVQTERRHYPETAARPDAVPRRLWHEPPHYPPRNAGTTLRLEIGQGTLGRSLEGINNMMRARAHAFPPHHTPYRYAPPNAASSYSRAPLATPVRTMVPTYPVTSSSSKPPPPRPYPPPPPATKPPTSTGKENTQTKPAVPVLTTPSSAKQEERVVCNCRQSNCLKLYCKCFSCGVYCNGCKCKDCNNLPNFEDIRQQAVKSIKAKNPHAFKDRISTASEHNMGCRCKRSECLKKYCECFQAGILCAEKCKCVGCMNYPNSQKLIDRRRSMKDKKGAELAMKAAQDVWQKSSASKPSSTPAVRGASLPSPAISSVIRPRSSTISYPPPPYSASRSNQPYVGRNYGVPPHHMPHYSPMAGMPHVTPGYSDHPMMRFPPPQRPPEAAVSIQSGSKRPTLKTTPRTPAIRAEFDPSSSRKKRRVGNKDEESFPYFGSKVAPQPKTTALAIFSFLSNRDTFNASLVNKEWRRLALDDELWKFNEVA